MAPRDPTVYCVYVIEFDADWVKDNGKGTVYVGYTARTPQQRLETHRAGGRTAAAVFKRNRKRRGTNLRLRTDLAAARPSHAGPWKTDTEAMKHERKLANRLKGHGYVVFVGLGKPFGSIPAQANS
ncbi:GIY-YIG nuclease family protein [Janibacter sp. Y6]|uniref:GIY-YIG nuclease family protein n=1 Tax=Janibacter sp. Y6 TaxID=2913552 RepID=UPI0034A3466F